MDWRVKAIIQKTLSLTRIGDKMNHLLATLNSKYHENIVTYQSHETLRKYSYTKLDTHNNLVALEIGTGYNVISAVSLALIGFKKVVTVDITRDISFSSFRKQAKFLREGPFLELIQKYSSYPLTLLESKISKINACNSFEELFKELNIIYLAPYTFDDITDSCSNFDYITSQVVLEHVSPELLNELFRRTKEWLKKDGYCVHTINFIDHFANPGFFQDKSISEFNFLRFSDKYWAKWAGNPIAYTNRLSYIFYLNLCKTYNITVVDFIGENYRKRVELNLNQIHSDILDKYELIPPLSELTKFQRGTLILKR